MARVDIPAKPNTREEAYLAAIAGQTVEVPVMPITREEAYLDAILKKGGGGGGTGDGDMKKSVYDKNNNGIVDNAEKVNNHTVDKDVPADAKFTDTVYDDTSISNRVSAIEEVVPSDATTSNKLATQSDIPSLTDYVQKSQTAGLLKNDGTVDTNSYETTTNVSGKENLKLASSGTTASGEIRFGVDGNGNYGYIKAGADSVTPFKNPTGNKAIPQITQNGTVTGIDVEDYATASLDIAVPAPVHTETYTPAANTAANDMGANHSYRYVNTSGMIVPSGTKNISITENGTITENVSNYASAEISVNVQAEIIDTTKAKYQSEIPKVKDAHFVKKSWIGGISAFYGYNVWTDGTDIYLSQDSTQKVLDRETSTWSNKTWNGLTSFDGQYVWTDGDNIYYSNGSNQYVLNKSTSTWSAKTWSGQTSFQGNRIWTDGENIYLSNGTSQLILDRTTSRWNLKTWNGMTSFEGNYVWTDGKNIYFSNGSTQKVLDKSTSTWSDKTWNGLSSFSAPRIFSMGGNIFFFKDTEAYILNQKTSTWSLLDIDIPSGIYGSFGSWSDGLSIYCSYDNKQYELKFSTYKYVKV